MLSLKLKRFFKNQRKGDGNKGESYTRRKNDWMTTKKMTKSQGQKRNRTNSRRMKEKGHTVEGARDAKSSAIHPNLRISCFPLLFLEKQLD